MIMLRNLIFWLASEKPFVPLGFLTKPLGHHVPIWLQRWTLTSCQPRLDELRDQSKAAVQVEGRFDPEFDGA